MTRKTIPQEVKDQVEQIVARFNEQVLRGGACRYVARFKGRYLYLDREDYGKTGPICRLEYRGKMDDWSFAIFKYSSERYSDSEFFPGDQYVDGTVEGAMKAGLEAYSA